MSSNAREKFLSAMSNVANSVTVVTTDGPGGKHGATVSSFCSVSADPPTVLVCLNRSGPTHDAIAANGVYCVNVLPEGMKEIARVFAGQTGKDGAERFTGADWQQAAGNAPALFGVTALHCKVDEAVEATSHTIFIGTVTGIQDGDEPPLIYLNRKYCKTSNLPD